VGTRGTWTRHAARKQGTAESGKLTPLPGLLSLLSLPTPTPLVPAKISVGAGDDHLAPPLRAPPRSTARKGKRKHPSRIRLVTPT
jgi:hypothetical protein